MIAKPIFPDVEPYSSAHLMQALKFTAEDLSANQEGQLSQSQRRVVRKDRQFEVRASIGCLGICIPIIIATLVLTVGESSDHPSSRLVLLPLFGWATFFIVMSGLRAIRLGSDLSYNRVYTITGPIHRSTRTEKNFTTYMLSIWAKSFTVSKDVFEAFAGGWVYTLYFGSSSNQLLSAEFVSQEKITIAPQAYLKWAMRIGPKEIEANAAGELSEAQRRTFEAVTQSYWTNLVSLTIFLGVVLSVGFSVWWPQPSLRIAVLVLLGGMCVIGFFVASTMRARRYGRVVSVHGRITRNDSELVVDGDKLLRVGALATAFISGKIYTIYYVPLKTSLFDHYDPIVSAVYHPDESEHHLNSDPEQGA